MNHWLDPVRAALDLRGEPVRFFCRDDDAGWNDERLFQLLDLFAASESPIDLAVIPQALTPELARQLRRRLDQQRLGLHQHGFAHVNHESEGRKCEFGQARVRALQEQDIASGKRLLFEHFGSHLQPIFTPPWNRCTAVTAESLVHLGFQTLSRDCTAKPLTIPGLVELPVQVDWFAKLQGERLNFNQLGELLAKAFAGEAPIGKAAIGKAPIGDAPIGLMFHHALMDEEERQATGELLGLLSRHPRAQGQLMQSLIGDHL